MVHSRAKRDPVCLHTIGDDWCALRAHNKHPAPYGRQYKLYKHAHPLYCRPPFGACDPVGRDVRCEAPLRARSTRPPLWLGGVLRAGLGATFRSCARAIPLLTDFRGVAGFKVYVVPIPPHTPVGL